MARRRSREIRLFGTSFLDVLANTIGGLAFLLVLAVLQVGQLAQSERPGLKIVTKEMPPAVAELKYIFFPAAEGGLPPYRWSVRGPSWLDRPDPNASSFAGTPSPDDIGSSAITLELTDSAGTTDRSEGLKIVVLPPAGEVPEPLRIKTETFPEGRIGQAYHLAIAVEGGLPPYAYDYMLSQGLTEIPGLRFDHKSGVLMGTPTAQMQELPVTIKVSSERTKESRPLTGSLTVRPAIEPVAIITRQAPLARVGTPYDFALSASGGFPPYHWEFKGALPAGLQAGIDGVISGKPTAAGASAFVVIVADAEGNRAPEPRRLTIETLTEQSTGQLRIITAALPPLLVGRETELSLTCQGGTGRYTWETDSALPAGLVLDPEGRITGSPQGSGEYDVALSVKDSLGQQARASVQLSIRRMVPLWWFVLAAVVVLLALALAAWFGRAVAGQRPPEIAPLVILSKSVPNARASCDYSVQLACMGGVGPYTWRLVGGQLPDGLDLAPDGRLHGRPYAKIKVNETVSVPFTVEVRDQRGQTAQQEL